MTTTLPAPPLPAAQTDIDHLDDMLTETPAKHRAPTKTSAGIIFAVVFVAIGAVLLALAGFYVSFDTVTTKLIGGPENYQAALDGLHLPHATSFTLMTARITVLGIDLGILIIAALSLLLDYFDAPLWWLRFISYSLIGTTVYLNIQAGHGAFEKAGHAAMPILWAAIVEVTHHIVRHIVEKTKAAEAAEEGEDYDGVPWRNWALDTGGTFILWRRMQLWNITSFKRALELEYDRQRALDLLRQEVPKPARWIPILWKFWIPMGDRAKLRRFEVPERLKLGEGRSPAQRAADRARRARVTTARVAADTPPRGPATHAGDTYSLNGATRDAPGAMSHGVPRDAADESAAWVQPEDFTGDKKQDTEIAAAHFIAGDFESVRSAALAYKLDPNRLHRRADVQAEKALQEAAART